MESPQANAQVAAVPYTADTRGEALAAELVALYGQIVSARRSDGQIASMPPAVRSLWTTSSL